MAAESEARRAEESRKNESFEMLDSAERLLEGKEAGHAVATLAQAIRIDHQNYIAAQRLVSLLMQRNFAVPILENSTNPEYDKQPPEYFVTLDESGKLLVEVPSKNFQSPPLQTEFIDKEYFDKKLVKYALNPERSRLGIYVPDEKKQGLWKAGYFDLVSGKLVGMWHYETINAFESNYLSPDGREFISASIKGRAIILSKFKAGSAIKNKFAGTLGNSMSGLGEITEITWDAAMEKCLIGTDKCQAHLLDASSNRHLTEPIPIEINAGNPDWFFSINGNFIIKPYGNSNSTSLVLDIRGRKEQVEELFFEDSPDRKSVV